MKNLPLQNNSLPEDSPQNLPELTNTVSEAVEFDPFKFQKLKVPGFVVKEKNNVKDKNIKRDIAQGAPMNNYKDTLPPFTEEQRDIIVGTLLGDATMGGLRNQRPQYLIKFEQGCILNRDEYIKHLFLVFSAFCSSGPLYRYNERSKLPKSSWFRTFVHPNFQFYFNLFHVIDDNQGSTDAEVRKRARKIVPSNIEDFLTPRAMAYWFMDDGSAVVQRGSASPQLYINTQGFTKEECELLGDAIKNKFEINVSVHRDGDKWRLYVPQDNCTLFRELIRPYIVPCFEYKVKL